MGSQAALKCESENSFDSCKFRSPTGEIYDIGISGGSSYNRARIDCLCLVSRIRENIFYNFVVVKELDYDPTLVCGIYIKGLRREDSGEWR